MFKLLAPTLVLASAVLAQTTVGFSSFFFISSHIIHYFVQTNSSANPLIPADISSTCTTYLITLNSDPTFASCLSLLNNITSAFAPGAPTPSSTDVTTALGNLCPSSVTDTCSDTLIRQEITNFGSACSTELTNNANGVRPIYDAMYILPPLRLAICSKDDSGNYCIEAPSVASRDFNEDDSFSISEILSHLYIKTGNGVITRRDQAIVPNLAGIASNNSLFDFFTPDLPEDDLCVTCAQKIITAYINFESDAPFAYSMNSSVLLAAQLALYSAVQSKCPANFLSGAVEAAGGLSDTSSAIPTFGAEYQRIITLVMGAVIMVNSFVL